MLKKINATYLLTFCILLYFIGSVFLQLTTAHHPTDDGYVLSQAWRVLQGDIPHRDFFSTRPAFSAYLHTIWFFLPRSLIFLAGRVSFFVLLFMTAMLSMKKINSKTPIEIYFVILGIAFSIHHFPPMPWYTVDCVFFSVLSLVCFFSENFLLQLLGAFLAGSIPWLKQSFFAFPLAYFLLSLLRIRKNRFSEWGFLCIPSFFCFGFLHLNQALSPFLEQIRSATTHHVFLRTSVHPYISINPVKWGSAVLGFGLGVALETRKELLKRISFLALFVLLFVFSLLITRLDVVKGGVTLFLFLFGLFVSDLYQRRNASLLKQEDLQFAFGGFVIAWCSGISYGWAAPLLGLAPVFVWIGKKVSASLTEKDLFSSLLPPIACTSIIAVFSHTIYHHPYRDESRETLHSSLKEITPRLPVFTNEVTFKRYQDLFQLADRVDPKKTGSLVVMPEFPIFYLLTDRKNPSPIDFWFEPVEYASLLLKNKIKQTLIQKNPILIIEFSSEKEGCEIPLYPDDTILNWVILNSNKIDQAGHFCAFSLK